MIISSKNNINFIEILTVIFKMCRNKILILFLILENFIEKNIFFLQRIIFLIITIIESFADFVKN